MFSKRAQLSEVIFIVIMLFGFVVAIIFGDFFQSKVITSFNNSFGNQEAVNVMSDSRSAYNGSLDPLSLIMAGILIVGAGVLAFVLPVHLVFIIIGIIGLFILVPASGLLKDIFFAITNETIINSSLIYYPITVQVMGNFPMICLIADVVFLVVQFVKGVMYQ